MKIEIRNETELGKNPVAKIWLDHYDENVVLRYSIDGGESGILAYFSDQCELVVFKTHMKNIKHSLREH